jgi:hypothetical protein
VSRFSKKVIRLLSDELTDTVLREIDVLFENNDIPLGPPRPDDNDPGQRRERMRRYLASINFSSPSDTSKLTRVYSDLMQDISGRDATPYRDKWVRTLRA